MYKVGISKKNISPKILGKGMLGYGRNENIAKAIDTPIYARAFVFEDEKGNFVSIVNLEIAFPSIALTEEILTKLNEDLPNVFSNNNLMLSAQHTHSGPSGFTHYIFYNIPTPGFDQHIFDILVNATVDAIKEAFYNRQPAKLSFTKGKFDDNLEVAFNRSLDAYNSNKELTGKLKDDKHRLGVDREMKFLKISTSNNEPLGSMNWFGVHATSLSNDNLKISGDNKGFAATYLEDKIRKESKNYSYVGAFMQDACGDISPNYIFDKKKKWTRGKFKDDYKSAKYNGQLQANKAIELNASEDMKVLNGSIDCLSAYFDMSDIRVDPEFSDGIENQYSASPILGLSFLGGTSEGPGAPKFVLDLMNLIFVPGMWLENQIAKRKLTKAELARMHRDYEMQEPKFLTVDVGRGRTLLVDRLKHLFFVPDIVDPLLKRMKKLDRMGKLKMKPWIGKIIPLQLMIIDTIAFVGIPTEITTMGAQRLRKTVLDVLQARGVDYVQITSYCNAFAGYVTTKEEYDLQNYEGGHTLFGKWTLAAFQTQFKKLAEAMLLPVHERESYLNGKLPVLFKPHEIWYGDI